MIDLEDEKEAVENRVRCALMLEKPDIEELKEIITDQQKLINSLIEENKKMRDKILNNFIL